MVQLDGSITYQDEDTGEQKPYVIDSMEDYHHVFSECQIMAKKGFEVSHRLFDMLTHKKDPPYLITGVPAVFVYREGTMKKYQQLDGLDVEDIIELRAKKARKKAEEAKIKKDLAKKDLENLDV